MKKNVLLIVSGLIFLAFLFFGASGGVTDVQRVDRTGAPGSASGCNSCHSGGNFNTSVSVQMLDGTNPITSYEPGKKYTFKVTISASNSPAGYGFQAVGVLASDNSNAGSFGTPPNETHVETLNGRQYFEHEKRNNVNTWSIEWTAPAAGKGEVRFYAAGNAVNGDGDTGGDLPARLSAPLVLAESMPSSLAAVQLLDLEMKVFPNPVQENLNLQIIGSENGRFQLSLLSAAGQLVRSGQISVTQGRAETQLPVQDLPKGLYFLHLSDGQSVKTISVIKQ